MAMHVQLLYFSTRIYAKVTTDSHVLPKEQLASCHVLPLRICFCKHRFALNSSRKYYEQFVPSRVLGPGASNRSSVLHPPLVSPF